jgi:hypothetical protein
MITQAFEFAAIRWLEGYWPLSASRVGVTGCLVRLQVWRSERVVRLLEMRKKKAFRAAREEMEGQEIGDEIIRYLKRIAYGEMDDGSIPEQVRIASGAHLVSPPHNRDCAGCWPAFPGSGGSVQFQDIGMACLKT